MKGYPKHINIKQDFENLLAIPEFRERALKDLQIISEMNITATKVISGSEETKDLVVEEIPNPGPLWKQKGFESREKILEVIATYEAKIAEQI